MTQLAIITGASRGIGKEAALYFAKCGYDVALIAQSEQALKTLSAQIKKEYGVNTGVFALDVSDKAQVEQCITTIAKAHDTIDVLVNSAGILNRGTCEISHQKFDKMIDVNVGGVFNLIHAVTPLMKKQCSGAIFNLASNAGKRPLARSGAYCMSKYAVVGFSQSLSLELAPFNIKVTAICPGVVDTDMTADFDDYPNDEKITCKDIITTIDYLLKLGPNASVDEVVIKSSHAMKNNLG
jgi:short-subunit dehydrogenase